MVKSLSIAVGSGVLLCALCAPAAAQAVLPFDSSLLPPDFDQQISSRIQEAMDKAQDVMASVQNVLPPDFNPLPPDFDEEINSRIQEAMDKAQDAIDKAQTKAQEAAEKAAEKASAKGEDRAGSRSSRGTPFAFQDANPMPMPKPMPNVRVNVPPIPPMPPMSYGGSAADSLYDQARDSIDRERYDIALRHLSELLRQYDGKPQPIEHRVDAALYWKAYTLGKEQQFADALSTIADLQKRFSDSRWLKDAKALDLELRQASGQAVSPDGQTDDELKLLALRGVMRSDPDRAVPMIERLLAGNSSVAVKENALFVLSQSQAPKAKEIITTTAKSGTNPDLQMRAVRYLGAMRTPDSVQTLDDIYKTTTDASVKRAIVQAMVSAGNPDKIAEIARNEKDVDLRRSAIRSLGAISSPRSSDLLRSMYASETSPEIKKDIINSLYAQRNAAALVEMARAEKDPAMKKEIVSKLSTMRSKEATDYMLELLK